MPEIGQIGVFAFSRSTETDPAVQALRNNGWIACEGQSVDQRGPKGLPSLFSVMQLSWGSLDPANVFNIPDLRGRFLRGWDHGAGRDADLAARKTETNSPTAQDRVGTFQDDAVQQHIHTDSGHNHDSIDSPTLCNLVEIASEPPRIYALANAASMAKSGQSHANLTGPIDPSSGQPVRQGHESHPLNSYVMFCIYTGTAPLPAGIPFFR